MTTLIRTFGGNIGIGTNDPGSYKLRVDGSVRATSLEVGGVTNAHIPSGAIGIWHGDSTDIPAGWVICDGTNDTPDLRNKFIRCANGESNVDQTGGSDNTTLSESMLAPHSHAITVQAADAPHKHNVANQQANHTHGTSNQTDSHNHTTQRINWRQNNGYINSNVGGSGNQLAIHATQGQNDNTNPDNGAHSHVTQYWNIPHSHGGGSNRSVHDHQASSADTGTGDPVPVTNPYYALYYIMKL
tara:strand:- start:54 stop:782 length:729 start_codon:yes stop_codon:yes gene_type:complete